MWDNPKIHNFKNINYIIIAVNRFNSQCKLRNLGLSHVGPILLLVQSKKWRNLGLSHIEPILLLVQSKVWGNLGLSHIEPILLLVQSKVWGNLGLSHIEPILLLVHVGPLLLSPWCGALTQHVEVEVLVGDAGGVARDAGVAGGVGDVGVLDLQLAVVGEQVEAGVGEGGERPAVHQPLDARLRDAVGDAADQDCPVDHHLRLRSGAREVVDARWNCGGWTGLVEKWGIERDWMGLSGIERDWTGLNGIERDWTGLNGIERDWTGLNGIERDWTGLNGI